MIGVDTNILVRFLTKHNDLQLRKALRLFENNDVFIADTVILETEWVLRYAYGFSGIDINQALMRLCGLPCVHLAHPNQLANALAWHKEGMDFADALHYAGSHACEAFASFDKAFIKQVKRQGLMPSAYSP